MSSPRPSFPPAVLEALRKGNKLEAIKLLRQASKVGLGEAKSLVEALQGVKPAAAKTEEQPVRPASVGAAPVRIGPPVPGYRPHSQSGLSPGEVPRAGTQVWGVLWIVVAVVVTIALL